MVALVAVVVAVASMGIPRITLKLDGRSLIPRGQSEAVGADDAARRFNQRDVVVVGISDPETVFKRDVLGWISAVGHDLGKVHGIVPGSIVSLATLPRLFVERDMISVEPLLDRGRPVDAELAARLARETVTLGLADGILVARDRRTTVIVAEVEADADRYALLAAVRGVLARPTPAGARVSLTGTALAQAVLGHACALDLLRLLPAVTLLVAGALTLAFWHPVPALVSLAEIAVSLVVTAGLMGFAGESIFVTTLILPVVALVIGVSDDVYALHRFVSALGTSPKREAEGRGPILFSTFSDVGWPVVLAAATTITGLLTLLVTELAPQRTFGLYGAISMFLSTLLTFTLVPALLMLLPVPTPRPPSRAVAVPADPWGLAWRALDRIGPERVLVAAALLAVMAAAIAPRLRIEDNWVRNLPPSSDIALGDHSLNETMAGTTWVELMLDTGRADGVVDPTVFAFLGRLETALGAMPGVGAATSPYSDVLRVRAALDGVPYQAAREAVARGTDTLSRADLESSLLLLGSLRTSPLDERIDGSRRRARISVAVRDASYSKIEFVVAAARALPAPPGLDLRRDLTPFGDGWISYLAVHQLVAGQVASVGLALFCDALLTFFLLRSLRLTLTAVVPVALAVLAVFATLALVDHPLGIASSMFTAIALGIGIDYSIHLCAHFKTERERLGDPREAMRRAFEVLGPAITKSTLAIAVGLAALGFSTVLPNRELGVLIPASLALCGVAALVLVPCLVLVGFARPVPTSVEGVPGRCDAAGAE